MSSARIVRGMMREAAVAEAAARADLPGAEGVAAEHLKAALAVLDHAREIAMLADEKMPKEPLSPEERA